MRWLIQICLVSSCSCLFATKWEEALYKYCKLFVWHFFLKLCRGFEIGAANVCSQNPFTRSWSNFPGDIIHICISHGSSVIKTKIVKVWGFGVSCDILNSYISCFGKTYRVSCDIPSLYSEHRVFKIRVDFPNQSGGVGWEERDIFAKLLKQ